ncbi:uncharacterized protein LOC124373750 [Homalodisca vitripennis]|uniref:uncharacterized protein LOC124373750 n=1 Tax=Homalodisca vitripennis TaxID=197043 RepID=UPI001EECD3AF|nr:uncharacterized protein LOC124373750 [Homalodisca vitripennis]
MLKHDLDTEGRTTDYLRKSFVQFLRSQPDRRDEAVGGRESFGNDPVGPNTSEAETDKRSRELNLREILEVPPDTSDDEVKRLLVSLKTRSKAKSNWDTGHDYVSYAPYDGATRSVYTDAFKLPALATSQYIAPGISHDSLRRHVTHYSNENQRLRDEHLSRQPHVNSAEICNTIRKWNLHFDGERNPVSFLERLDELMEAYNVSGGDLIKALPELLKGTALLWYRNNREFWDSFEDFRQDFELNFLPVGYKTNMDDEIKRRTQGDSEPIRTFVVALNTLMRRRGGMTPVDKLDRLYANMHPKYKLSLKRQDIRTISELISSAETLRDVYPRNSLISATARSSSVPGA